MVALAHAPAPARADAVPGFHGIVEGSYGTVWTHDERSRVLSWMGPHGFNAYIHAPKDDPYQRASWRQQYPLSDLGDFRSEIQLAAARGIQWIPSISPGQHDPSLPTATTGGSPDKPACFSCTGASDDAQTIADKLQPFVAAGATTVMVSFDDDQIEFTHAEDVAKYNPNGWTPDDPRYQQAYGQATAAFLNRVHTLLPGVKLLTILIDYAGTSGSPYLTGVRTGLGTAAEATPLDPSIGVLWTGPYVRHADFSPSDAAGYAAAIGRNPIVWDNWGNEDGCCTIGNGGHTRVFLGAYMRRADIGPSTGGFFLNPMNEADLNLLPLATAGEWMRDPSTYDPRASWLRAVNELAGGDAGLADVLRAWAETSYWTKSEIDRDGGVYTEGEAPTFASLANSFVGAYDAQPDWSAPYAALLHELDLTSAAPDRLGAMPDPAFFQEAQPFLAAARQGAGTARLGAQLLAAERPSINASPIAYIFAGQVLAPDPRAAASARASEHGAEQTFRSTLPCTYGWRQAADGSFPCDPGAKDYLDHPSNVLDSFLAQVDQRDQAWQAVAARAYSSVSLTLAGRKVPLDAHGGFTLPASACHLQLVATDGAGGRTTTTLAPCPPRARDLWPPLITLTLRRQRLATVLAHGLTVDVRCSEACRTTVDIAVTDRRRVSRSRFRTVQVRAARVTDRRLRFQRARLALHVNRRYAVRLRALRRVVLAVTVRATDAAGNSGTRSERVTVVR